MRAYPIETVVSEKVEAIVKLGMANSRMKDYYDLWVIPGTFAFDGRVLMNAFTATFERRGTALPTADPVGLTRDFGEAPDNVKRWRAFLDTNDLEDAPREFHAAIDTIREFVRPPLRAAAQQHPFEHNWAPGRGWK